jgi:hypothetical protein
MEGIKAYVNKLHFSFVSLVLSSFHYKKASHFTSLYFQQFFRVRVRVTLQLTVSQSICLGVEPNLGLLTRDFFFFFKVTDLSFGGSLSDERSGLSFVSLLSIESKVVSEFTYIIYNAIYIICVRQQFFGAGFSLCSLGTHQIENTASNISSVVPCLFVAAEMGLLCCCLAISTSSCPTVIALRDYVTIFIIAANRIILNEPPTHKPRLLTHELFCFYCWIINTQHLKKGKYTRCVGQ